ncbi:MAG: class I mannose-6-phosphate isomerase [Bacteroidales bacterium]|nr:class I mannose-6-phosphate isomerase [Bacteroidales bacterium]
MEEKERRLYPMKFLDNVSQTPWGHVSYKIADLGFVNSMVAEGWFGGNTLEELMGTYMERVVGDDAFEYYGLQFPILIKEIHTSVWQPLQVNVPDGEAEQRYDSLGKAAMWHVLEAEPDAKLYLGLKRDVEPEDFYRRCMEGRIEEILNEFHPVKGDSFTIEPGTVFAAGPGLTILEISESSELTFNIHDLGSNLSGDDPILLEEAFDLITFLKYSPAAEREEFKVTRMDLKDPLHIFSDQPGPFSTYSCVSGEAIIQPGPGAESFTQVNFKAGQTVLVPSEVNDILLLPAREGTVLLETTVERRTDPDSYIGDSQPDSADSPDPHLRIWN